MSNKAQPTSVYGSFMTNFSGDDMPLRESRYKSNDPMDLSNIGTETKPVTQADLSIIVNMAAESLSLVPDQLHHLIQSNHHIQLQSAKDSSMTTSYHKKLLDLYPNLLAKNFSGDLDLINPHLLDHG
jgi:hypothetical protein